MKRLYARFVLWLMRPALRLKCESERASHEADALTSRLQIRVVLGDRAQS
jgi:hypothetical protein